MTTRYPPANLPSNMTNYQRALENTLNIAESAQDNANNIISSMRQSIASNYGLGSTLPGRAGNLTDKVATNLQSMQMSLPSSIPFTRSWTTIGNPIQIASPAFLSNVALSVAATTLLDITGGSGGVYSYWLRVNVSGAFSTSKMIPIQNFGQVLFSADEIPPSSVVSVRLQIWGTIQNPDNTFVDGVLTTSTFLRLSTSMRSIALV